MRHLLALCCLLWAANGSAQFTGRVTATDGTPLIGANVIVGDDRGFGGATDAEGRFVIKGVRPGTNRVRVSMVGYADLDTAVVMAETATSLDLRLREDPIALQAAEVTALRASDRSETRRTSILIFSTLTVSMPTPSASRRGRITPSPAKPT